MTFTKTETPRETAVMTIKCHAPPELIAEDWDDLTDAAMKWHADNKALMCEGTGHTWGGCTYCQFCEFEHEAE